MRNIFNFIKQQWFGSLLIVLFLLYLFYGVIQNEKLHFERQLLEKEIEVLKSQENKHWSKLDSLKIENKTIIQKQKTLIQLQHDTIEIIDTIAFSKLQEFFSNRYSQKDSIK